MIFVVSVIVFVSVSTAAYAGYRLWQQRQIVKERFSLYRKAPRKIRNNLRHLRPGAGSSRD